MTPGDFDILSAYLKKSSGLALKSERASQLEARMMPLVRAHGLGDMAGLSAEVRRSANKDLLQSVTEAMASTDTSFFRDRKPFDAFIHHALPAVMERNAATRKIRIWSAGTANGQEAYALAILLREQSPTLNGWDISITGTDLSAEQIDIAERGEYSQFDVQRGLPVRLLIKYFTQTEDRWRANDILRDLVSFGHGNLLDDFSGLGKFDAIVCRNTLADMDGDVKRDILGRLRNNVEAHGFLVTGAGENFSGFSNHWLAHAATPNIYTPRA